MANVSTNEINWKVDVNLLTNRHMLIGFAKAIFGAVGIVVLLIGFLMAMSGDLETIFPLAKLLFAIGCVLYLFGLLIMAVLYRNKVETSYILDNEGISMAVTDKIVTATNKIGMIAGVVLGSAATTGSAMLAAGQQLQDLKWSSGAFRAIFEPATRSVALVNNWRVLMRVYCLENNYSEVVTYIQEHMNSHQTAAKVLPKSPVGKYALRTLMVVIASIPLFAVCDVFEMTMFLPFLAMCFAIAAVWFVAPLAWVTIGILGLIGALAVLDAFSMRQSYFRAENYQRFEVLSGDDWALTTLGIIGAAVLIWFCLSTIRGKIIPAYTQDLMDMGD